MGAMKDLFITVTDNLEKGNYAEALELLKPWGADAPNQLWGVIEMLSTARLERSQNSEVREFSGKISIEEFTIKATSAEQAEAIYNAYQTGDGCPVHLDPYGWTCDCYESFEEVSHTIEEAF